MKAHVFYISNNRSVSYIILPISYQISKWSILIVLNPSSFLEKSKCFLHYPSDYLYFKGLDATKKTSWTRWNKKEIYQSVWSCLLFYRGMSHNIQVEILTIIAGGFLGIATSILLFNTRQFSTLKNFVKLFLLKNIRLNFFWVTEIFYHSK